MKASSEFPRYSLDKILLNCQLEATTKAQRRLLGKPMKIITWITVVVIFREARGRLSKRTVLQAGDFLEHLQTVARIFVGAGRGNPRHHLCKSLNRHARTSSLYWIEKCETTTTTFGCPVEICFYLIEFPFYFI